MNRPRKMTISEFALAAQVTKFRDALEAIQKRTNKIYAMGHEEARRAAVDCYELASDALKPSVSQPTYGREVSLAEGESTNETDKTGYPY